MKITRVSYERYDLRMRSGYTIAYESIDSAVNFVLRIETTGKNIGQGCAAPDFEVTGERPDEVERLIRDVLAPYLQGQEALAYARLIRDVRELPGVGPSVACMVDNALHDLIAKEANMPLYKFLGAYRSEIATSVTVGILPADETLEEVRAWVARGFRIIKVKGGLSLHADLERLTLVRELYPHIELRFDGNQGYTERDAIEFEARVRPIGVTIFEQPISISNEHGLGALTAETHIPVMADESLKTLADAFRLARHDRVDMINIKLQKVGGILEGLSINSVARAADMETMVGCLDECSLGIAAGLHFALSRPNVAFADLDGHLDFEADPFSGLFTLEGGVLRPTEAAGLG